MLGFSSSILLTVHNCQYFYSNAMAKDSSLSTAKSNFLLCIGGTRLYTADELWLILYTVLSLNIYMYRELTAWVFHIYPWAGTTKDHLKFTHILGKKL